MDFFKALAANFEPESQDVLADESLFFVLEYEERPELKQEHRRLRDLFEGSGFNLFHYSEEDDPDLLILQFRRVVPDQSPEYLFQQAQELNDALNIVSVTPEIPPAWEDFQTAELSTESGQSIYSALCESDAPSPSDPHWAIKLIKADVASKNHSVDGSGVIIAQPDTGVASHKELEDGAVDPDSGFNVFDNSRRPIDPLLPKMKAPGHGTATSSVVSSRETLTVRGAAPSATVVPVRCVNSVVLGTGTRVARAIDFATRSQAQVITMSLGGPIQGRAMSRAIRRAYNNHLIILAAAGNCVKFVTFPARNPKVIAVAGIDEHMDRWRGSCRGPQVDFAAPAENVYVARRRARSPENPVPPADLSEIGTRGQGTSFAVALTAGVAALWIEKFGHATLIAEAENRGIVLQELFRAAVTQSANTPQSWDPDKMGAGIVDADQLLALPLSDIQTGGDLEVAAIAESDFGGEDFPARFQAELEYLEFCNLIQQDSESAVNLEAASDPFPSAQLAKILGRETNAVNFLRELSGPPMPVEKLIQIAFGSEGSGLENAGRMSAAEAQNVLRNEDPAIIRNLVADKLTERKNASDSVNEDTQSEAFEKIELATNALKDVNRTDDLTQESRLALEALVKLTGRPALRVPDTADGIGAYGEQLGEWQSMIIPNRKPIFDLAASVGRIDINMSDGSFRHSGTGFVIEPGRILTNRHVLDTFCETVQMPDGSLGYVFSREASIVFDNDAANIETRFEITGLSAAGRHPIGRVTDFKKLDAAILEVETENANGHPLPAPIEIDATAIDHSVQQILTIGFPGKSRSPSGVTSSELNQFWDRIDEIFGDQYGVKYFAPGEIVNYPGQLSADPLSWIFSHEATTLPGNSGSPIFDFKSLEMPIGLHFAGASLSQNLGHELFASLNSPGKLVLAKRLV